MSINPETWEALERAVGSLSVAIDTTLVSVEGPHVLQRTPAERDDFRSLRESGILDMTRDLQKMGTFQSRLERMQRSLLAGIGRMQSSLTPIGAVPAEILREIILHAANPRDHRSILTLASVCNQWRAIVHEERALWSDANWDAWPPSLLSLWCSRARGHPIAVRLSDPSMMWAVDSEYTTLLESTKPYWNSLHIIVAHSPLTYQGYAFACKFLFDSPLPALKHLTWNVDLDVHGGVAPEHQVVEVSAPNLETISWESCIPVKLLESTHSLRSITITPNYWSEWRQWISVLKASPSASHVGIDLKFAQADMRASAPPPETTLPSILSLTAWSEHWFGISRNLELIRFPNLRELALHGDMSEPYSTQLALCFHRSAPAVTCLRIHHHFKEYRPTYRALLEFLKDSTTIFPALDDFTVTIADHAFTLPWHQIRDVVRELVAARKLRRLALPNLSQTTIDELEGEFDFLTVTSSVRDYATEHASPVSSFSEVGPP